MSLISRFPTTPDRRVIRLAVRGCFGLMLAAVVTCGGGDGSGPDPDPIPTSIAIQGAGSQNGQVATAVATKPSVLVKDGNGQPMGGVTVVFSVASGGGAVSGGTPSTGNNGVATVGTWVLGPGVGVQTLRATVSNLTPVLFQATAGPGPAASITILSGNNQLGLVGAPLLQNLSVRVSDQFDNNTPGVSVTFVVATGGGSVNGGQAVTDAAGVATSGVWTLGGALGANTLSAAVTAVAPAVFTATGVTGPAASMVLLAGGNQTAPSGTIVPVAPQIMFHDQFGHPVNGATASIASVTSGGATQSSQYLSNSSGLAAIIGWTIAGLGANAITVTNPCCTDVIVTATATLGPPSQIAIVAGSGQAGEVQTTLPVDPTFRVLDAGFNPVPGVEVAFALNANGGTLGAVLDTTDAAGLVSPGTWTLGTLVGFYDLTAMVVGTAITQSLQGTANPGPVALISKVQGDGQSVTSGTQVPIRPRVLITDQFNNAVAGHTVTFSVTGGSGTIGAPVQISDVDGFAMVGSWTLGPIPGANSLQASGGPGMTVSFLATGLQGPAGMIKIAGDNQTGLLNTDLPISPQVQVRDNQGQPVAGVIVNFGVITPLGGSVNPAVDTSDAQGMATSGVWRLGTLPGQNVVRASSAGLVPVDFTATGAAGAPATVTVHQGNNQTQIANQAVNVDPAVLVVDQFGNPTGNVTVDFAVATGGGSATGLSAVTGVDGIATIGSWVLGSAAGSNTLTATVAALGVSGNPVTFTATGIISSFTIEIRPLSSLTPPQQATFDGAKARLEAMIIGDVPDVAVNIPAGACISSQPAVNETIDDVVIFAEVVGIDGPGGILAEAGPCVVRPGNAPALGIMRFDNADLQSIQNAGLLPAVITHEMMHVLGFGTIWQTRNLLTGAGTNDPFFPYTDAVQAFDGIGGLNYPGPKVPVENSGGPGTADSHWRESVFGNELMTGFVDGTNPLSTVTIYSFKALGYQIFLGVADPFTVGPFPAPGARPRTRLTLRDDIWRGPLFEAGSNGTLRPIPRQ